MKKALLFVVLTASLAAAVGCSSKEVRSDSGPSTTASKASDAKETDTQSTTTAAPSSSPKDSPYLYLQGTVTVPAGDAGKLSVVYIGKPAGSMGSTVPVLIRNNTAEALDGLEVNGTARAADGTLAGSGSSQGFEPAVLQPGEWAMGYVYFSSDLASDATVEATATGREGSGGGIFSTVHLKVNEFNVQPGKFNSTTFVGILANPGAEEASDPISVYVGCFDAQSNLLEVFSGHANGAAPAGGTASFSVDAYEAPACAAYAVAASGWNR